MASHGRFAVALGAGHDHEQLVVAVGTGGVDGEAAGGSDGAIHVGGAVDLDHGHEHRHRRRRPGPHQQVAHRGHVLQAPVDLLAGVAAEGAQAHRGGRRGEGLPVEGDGLVGGGGVQVDVLGVEVALAGHEAAPAAGLRVGGQAQVGLAGAPGVTGDEVAGVRAARGDAADPGEGEPGLQHDAHEAGRVGTAHAAALEDEGDVVGAVGDGSGPVVGVGDGDGPLNRVGDGDRTRDHAREPMGSMGVIARVIPAPCRPSGRESSVRP